MPITYIIIIGRFDLKIFYLELWLELGTVFGLKSFVFRVRI